MTRSDITAILDSYSAGKASISRSKAKRGTKYRFRTESSISTITIGRKSITATISEGGTTMHTSLLRLSSLRGVSLRCGRIIISADGGMTISIPIPCGRKRKSMKEITENRRIEIYTDGGCLPGDGGKGPGAWSYIILCQGNVIARKTWFRMETDSFEMEHTALLRALERIRGTSPSSVHVYSDCQSTMVMMERSLTDEDKAIRRMTAARRYVGKYAGIERSIP